MTEFKGNNEEKPKILIVIGVLWIGGGAEKVAAALGNYFTNRGYETHLLTFYEYKDTYPYHGIYSSFNEKPKTNRLLKVFNIPIRVWKIHQYIRKNNIDVTYSFLEEANFYTLTAKLLFESRLRVIVSVRNNIRKRSWLFQKISKLLYPYAEKVVSVTKAVEQILVDDLGLNNTTTIYNPLDLEMIERKKQEPLPASYEWLHKLSPLCISVGRLTQQKGQWHMIRAFGEVAKKYPSASLVILGEGEYKDKLQTLIQDSGLEDNVFLLGNHSNVYQFLNAADLFVFSSLWEGMPNTMLEALSVGLPIISTDCVSGPREIIAPDVDLLEEINYPYKTSLGVLTKTPNNESPIWITSEKKPLTDEEKQLSSVIIEALDNNNIKGLDYTEYKDRSRNFAYNTIMSQWESLLT